MSNNLVFKISDDGNVSMDIDNPNGSTTTRVVNLDDFTNAFVMDQENIDLPLFPRGLRKYKTRGDRALAVFELDTGIVHDVTWNQSDNNNQADFKNVPFPNSLWFVSLGILPNNKFTILKVNVVATNCLGLVNERSKMYEWPFPNHTISYGVCWGSDRNFERLKTSCSLSDLSSLPTIYFSASFNDDLGYSFLDPDNEFTSINIFECIEGRSNFDDKYLSELSSSLDDLMDSMI